MGLFSKRKGIGDDIFAGGENGAASAAGDVSNGAAGSGSAGSAGVSAAGSGSAGAQTINNDELIAVIAAAVSAFESEQFVQTLRISKINRTAGTRPAWGVAGTSEAIDARRM